MFKKDKKHSQQNQKVEPKAKAKNNHELTINELPAHDMGASFYRKPSPKFCDGLTVGQYLNIDGQKLRVIGIDADTVTMNVGGHPVVWQRQWLNDYPQSQICKLD